MLEMAAVLIVAALMTPPDPVSQVMVAVPSFILCQIVFWWMSKSRKPFFRKESQGDSNDSNQPH
jgi:Sec-independent protein secretion pathway component TatC